MEDLRERERERREGEEMGAAGCLTRFCSVKQVGMVAAFAKLHQNVEQLHFPLATSPIHHINILHQYLGVPATWVQS